VQQFSFWHRSAAVSAASSDGVSPFETSLGGDPRELAGGTPALRQSENCLPPE